MLKIIQDSFGLALPRFVICPGRSCHHLNHSYSKLNSIWIPAPRSVCLIFSPSSHWLLFISFVLMTLDLIFGFSVEKRHIVFWNTGTFTLHIATICCHFLIGSCFENCWGYTLFNFYYLRFTKSNITTFLKHVIGRKKNCSHGLLFN